jgi:L-lactate dehydrogenase complex protein LldG
VWESLTNDYPLAEAFAEAGIRIDPDISKAQAGITGASAGVAETGSIILASSPDRPGKTSLLPSVHIVILENNRIYENLPQVIELEEVREASAVTIVSGPSRTADIEMTLTIGVHGPGEVIVFLLR